LPERFSEQQLRLCVRTANRGHDPAPSWRRGGRRHELV
jgi:hypothetical protein